MSTACVDELALAATLREVATKAHNATRERDRLTPAEFPAWSDIPIDQREAWIAAARHVLAHYACRELDVEALVRAATLELCSTPLGKLGRAFCEQTARTVLRLAGLVPALAEKGCP